mmetsp:Transcript_3372/g.10423  ORF Transcript_3372/g.10423 Transcript_3372/m.10423 type:complete len:212 (+) Transcript_3372:1618-2253(+)
MREALQHGVHKTRISEIRKPDRAARGRSSSHVRPARARVARVRDAVARRRRVSLVAAVRVRPVAVRRRRVARVRLERRAPAALDVRPHATELLRRDLQPPLPLLRALRDRPHFDPVARDVDDPRLVPERLVRVLRPDLAGVALFEPAPVVGAREERLQGRLVVAFDPRVPARRPAFEMDLHLGARRLLDLDHDRVEPPALGVARVDRVARF